MPLLWLSLAFVCGILLGWAGGQDAFDQKRLATWLILACVSLALSLLRRLRLLRRLLRRRWPALPARLSQGRLGRGMAQLSELWQPLTVNILLACLFLGAARMELAQPRFTPASLAAYNDGAEMVTLEGVLLAPAEEADAVVRLKLGVERLKLAGEDAWQEVEGRLLVRLEQPVYYQYGDRLRLKGYLATPPEFEDFSYRDYLARQQIYSLMSQPQMLQVAEGAGQRFSAWIWALRARALQVIYRIFPDPESALLAGILLGVEGGIPEDLFAAFRDTGTAHIIAISGFNMAIVAGLFSTLFSRVLGWRWGALAAILGLGLYTLLVGAGAGVVRAAVMGGMALFAAQVGRRQMGVNSLAFIAALMTGVTPFVLWDVSFQMSFAATLGLVLFAEPLTTAFTTWASRWMSEAVARRLAGPVGEYFLFTLAAQALVLPLIVYHFQAFSLASLLANPLILPAQPALMMLGGLALLIGLAWLPAGQVAAYLAWPFAAYTNHMAELLARLPLAARATGPIGLGWIIAFYLALLTLSLARQRLNALSALVKPAALFLALAALCVVAWRAYLSLPDGLLHLTVLDVGAAGRSGDALLIETPSGGRLLLGGGPSPNRLAQALGRRVAIGGRKLDWLVVAGTQENQVGALGSGLERFLPQRVLWSGSALSSPSALALQKAVVEAQLPVLPAETGQTFDLGDEVLLEVLTASERGVVLRLRYGNFRALLPLGEAVDPQAGYALGPYSGLLLAGNGDAALNSPALLAAAQPQVLLLSVAAGDENGLPHPELLAAVASYNLLRSDQRGWIELSTDGTRMWLATEK